MVSSSAGAPFYPIGARSETLGGRRGGSVRLRAAARGGWCGLGPVMGALVSVVDIVLNLFQWVLILHVVMSWLVAFNVVNTRNQVVHQIGSLLYRVTEPVLRPFRRFIPPLGGIDITPVIVLLLVFFLRKLLYDNFGHAMM
jgi:YggT family protein